MTRFKATHERVVAAAKRGFSLDEIDRAIIEPTTLSDEEKAALWIVAQHEVTGIRRYEAKQTRLWSAVRRVALGEQPPAAA